MTALLTGATRLHNTWVNPNRPSGPKATTGLKELQRKVISVRMLPPEIPMACRAQLLTATWWRWFPSINNDLYPLSLLHPTLLVTRSLSHLFKCRQDHWYRGRHQETGTPGQLSLEVLSIRGRHWFRWREQWEVYQFSLRFLDLVHLQRMTLWWSFPPSLENTQLQTTKKLV